MHCTLSTNPSPAEFLTDNATDARLECLSDTILIDIQKYIFQCIFFYKSLNICNSTWSLVSPIKMSGLCPMTTFFNTVFFFIFWAKNENS